ncbi:MAG: site-specific integrase [Bacteroidaceae bacterium]|nr:site-specific integrase [Bacteroidaceae bacterium]
MATLRLCVREDRWTAQGNSVKIALAHKGATVYIPTPVVLRDPKQWRDGRVVQHECARDLNKKLRNMLGDLEDRLYEVVDIGQYSCKALRDVLMGERRANEEMTLVDAMYEYIHELTEDGRASYARFYIMEISHLVKYGCDNLPLKNLTPKIINDYSRWLSRQGLALSTIGIALRNVRTVVNRAIRLLYVRYDVHPFTGIKIPSGCIREIDVDVEVIRKIRDAEIEVPRKRMVRDLFMLSFYCAGINLVDIVNADWRGERLEYVRKKIKNRSQQKVSICIVDEAREIVNRYMGADGRLEFGYSFTYRNFCHYVSRIFRMLMDDLGLDNVLMYSARKTWAQIAMEIGVGESVIDYCLGHSDSKRGIIRYYTKVRARMADDAVRRVLEYVNGDDESDDIIEFSHTSRILLANGR